MNFIMVFGFSLLYRQKLHELHKFMWNLRIMFFSMIWDDSNLTACTKKSHDQSHKCAYFRIWNISYSIKSNSQIFYSPKTLYVIPGLNLILNLTE